MRFKILMLLPLLLIGCKGSMGSRGDRGDTGIQGARGPGSIEIISGPVTNDDFFIMDSRIKQASEINVYLNNDGNLVQLPIFLPAMGVNCFYAVTLSQSKIELFKAMSAGSSQYLIVLII